MKVCLNDEGWQSWLRLMKCVIITGCDCLMTCGDDGDLGPLVLPTLPELILMKTNSQHALLSPQELFDYQIITTDSRAQFDLT